MNGTDFDPIHISISSGVQSSFMSLGYKQDLSAVTLVLFIHLFYGCFIHVSGGCMPTGFENLFLIPKSAI